MKRSRPRIHPQGGTPQESVERIAQVTDVLFRAPSFFFSYSLILILPLAIVPLFWRQFLSEPGQGMAIAYRNAYVLFAVPAILAAAGGWRLARLYGGTFDRRRSAFTALAAHTTALVIVAVGGLLHRRGGYDFHDPIILGFATTILVHQVALFTTSDHRQIRSAQVALIHPISGLLLLNLLYETPDRIIALSVVLPVAFLATTMFFLDLVDAPVRRTTGLSLSEMFRHFLDHLATASMKGEELMLRIASEIEAFIGVASFRKADGSVKAAIVVPGVHPGPVGQLGGSNLPTKVAQAVQATPNVMVPHGPATHDFNPASQVEVERIGEAARQLIDEVQYSPQASPLLRRGTDVQVCGQFFGDGVMLTYTSWPNPIDDVDFGVGEAAILNARRAGASEGLFIDAHNSLLLGSGAVWTSDRRAVRIVDTAYEVTEGAIVRKKTGLRVGYAQNRDALTRREGIGETGCQVLVTEVDGRKSAYILWDGNNMLPEVRGRIRDGISDLVDEFEVMTTDNHSVNIVVGGYNPVGLRADIEKIALVTRTTLERAILDLEPCEAGIKTGRVPGLKVIGHWNTIRLVSAVHTAVSLIPRAAVVLLLMQVLIAILVLVWVNNYF